MIIGGREINIDKIIKELELVQVFEFKGSDFDKKSNTITIFDNQGFFKSMIFHQQLNDRKMIPKVLLKSPTGKEMEFTNPMNVFSGFEYEHKNLKLRINY